jgi:aarF domain-containing kinase
VLGDLPFEEVFEEFEIEPLGSGCIAQVHRARLKHADHWSVASGEPTGSGSGSWHQQSGDRVLDQWVVVKVKRRHADSTIRRDLRLMKLGAAMVGALPTMEWLALPKAAARFEGLLLSQLDLRTEGRNLDRFRQNFDGSTRIGFPMPLHHTPPTTALATAIEAPVLEPVEWAEMLVESLEPGLPLQQVLKQCELNKQNKALKERQKADGEGAEEDTEDAEEKERQRQRQQAQQLGVAITEGFFEMVLTHNFVHSDLHPGNVLVQNFPVVSSTSTTTQRVAGGSVGDSSYVAAAIPTATKLMLLDAGLTTELSPAEKDNFIELFVAVAEGDGRRAARLMWERAPAKECEDPTAFIDGMERLLTKVGRSSGGTNLALDKVHPV